MKISDSRLVRIVNDKRLGMDRLDATGLMILILEILSFAMYRPCPCPTASLALALVPS